MGKELSEWRTLASNRQGKLLSKITSFTFYLLCHTWVHLVECISGSIHNNWQNVLSLLWTVYQTTAQVDFVSLMRGTNAFKFFLGPTPYRIFILSLISTETTTEKRQQCQVIDELRENTNIKQVNWFNSLSNEWAVRDVWLQLLFS